MAFKFILGRHIKAILNDAEEQQKRDIKDYAGGHLNESVILRKPLVLNRRSWASAHTDNIHLTKPVKPLNNSRVLKGKRSPKDALYDFALGTSGVLPQVQETSSNAPMIRYRFTTDHQSDPTRKKQKALTKTKSLYSELEDGVLIEELPPLDLTNSNSHYNKGLSVTNNLDDKLFQEEDGMAASEISFSSMAFKPDPSTFFKNTELSTQNLGITRKERYRKIQAFNLAVLQERETNEQLKMLLGETTAWHHEQKLQQELSLLNVNNDEINLHRVQACNKALDDIMQESPSLNYLLHSIKIEYDNYIQYLLSGQASLQHIDTSLFDQLTSLGTSQPSEMAVVAANLTSLEEDARQLLDMNQKLHECLKTEREEFKQIPETPVKKISFAQDQKEKEQPLEFSVQLENMKALILEKMDELNALRLKTRAEYVPVTVCTHLEQCIKETEVEVQKLLKQNEYFDRCIAEMEAELKEAITEADTSEKDARRIWHKVNSTRGLPGVRQGTGPESDEDVDDESKWNWYIS